MTSTRYLTSISLAALALGAPALAFAQDAAADAGADAAKDIVVTGSRVAGRSRLDSTAPVDVFNADSLKQQGTPQLATALANVAPSIDFPRPSNTDATDAIRPATLRGMSPDQTLVLINGVRAHASSVLNLNGSVGRGSQAVDLNTIPTVALDGIEVLRDGASAQYGSDAIAGVIDLKLRKADHGGGANISYGIYDTSYTGVYGKHSVTGEPTVDVSGWQGFKLGEGGFLTVSGDYQHTSATNRADNDPRTGAVKYGTVDSRTGDPDVFQGSGFANFGKALTDTWSLYGWAGYQYRNTISNATLRDPNVSSPAYGAYGITSIYPTGYIPQINTHSKDLNTALGVKGEIAGWTVDAKFSYGMNKVDFWTLNSANYSYGAATQTNFYDGSLKYDQTLGGVDVAKKLDVLQGLNVAWGVEARRETYSIGAGEPASYNTGTAYPLAASGAQGFGGFKNTDALNAHRSNVSAYVDLDQQVTQKLRLGAAGRFEHYSDFGSTATWKASGRYDFSPVFALRSTISSGFRAPSLGQEYYTSTASVLSTVPITVGGVTYPINTPVTTGTYSSTSAVGKALGGQPLRPEKSINYSAGGVFRLGGLDLTVDGYYIKVRDALALSENISTSSSTQVAAILNAYGVSQARFFINGVHTTTRGIDAIAHYKQRTQGFGNFDFTLAGNINKITVDSVPTNTATLNPAPTLFARTRIITMQSGTPGEKVTGTLDWTKGKIGATARVTYYGNVVVPATLAVNDASTGPRAITDLEARYQPTDTALSLAIGVNNLFDVYGRANPTNVNTTGSGTFPAYVPWGMNGRYLYVRAGLKW
ncbi:TonB-dependent receptor plug domain-containing protein [Novosphingobium terrae]|uniref:TonB-dependent receptor plug domain-containing protein n=1 Tax=Novosphingobium terrae TaxID=2726189 RepID=UPI001981D755|nr:TonB-dependent receptor [Novosphingobium terrae]